MLFMFCDCHVVLPVYCSPEATCLEKAALLALLYVMFYCVFSLSHVVFGQVCLVVSIPVRCLLSYFL